MIAVLRMRWDPATRDYVARRTRDGLSKREIIRCLKRYIARQTYHAITADLAERPVRSQAAPLTIYRTHRRRRLGPTARSHYDEPGESN